MMSDRQKRVVVNPPQFELFESDPRMEEKTFG